MRLRPSLTCKHNTGGDPRCWIGIHLAFTRYCFILKLYCGSPSSVYPPPPIYKAYPIAILLHDHCAIYAPPPTPSFYAIHHTILVIAISCKGLVFTYSWDTATRIWIRYSAWPTRYMTGTRTYSRGVYSYNRLNVNIIPHSFPRSVYSTCRAGTTVSPSFAYKEKRTI